VTEDHLVRVNKLDAEGRLIIAYPARLIWQRGGARLVEGIFNIEDMAVGKVWFRRGDHILEWYSTEHRYNLLQVHEQDSKQLKAWYCNISLPAVFTEGEICWLDLALDLLVYPDGSMELLDQDEFASLVLDRQTRAECWRALQDVLGLFKNNSLPFQEGC
jgi:hypothetical protein